MILPSAESFEHQLFNAINTALEKKVEDLRARIVAEAVKQFETEMRDLVAHVAMSLVSEYNIERQGEKLVISVKIKGPQ